ncbi:MAG: TonB-dependent receptor [Bacteroidales bacterium]|nr:TonB-dependent receptor [Bacteroidales bacterium]
MKLFFTVLFCIYWGGLFAQTHILKGTVLNKKGQPIEFVNITIKEINQFGTMTNETGQFELKITDKTHITLIVSHVEYRDTSIKVNLPHTSNITIVLNNKIEELPAVTITEKIYQPENIEKLNPKIINIIPDAFGGIEATLKSMPGVSKTNELSSQYSVRGGNFDENLVYVNNIEIYRPTLIRSGQQEGLSFVNTDMVSNVYFSAGGFSANYGDKMASVLDVTYKKPTKHAVHIMASLLGGQATVENCSKNYRFTHISGFRYKSSQYLLNTLDTKGDYKPRFFDYQTFLTYDINEKTELSFLANIAQNQYRFVPETRETSFGTVDEALKLKIYFDGKENDYYTSSMGAFSVKQHINQRTQLQYTLSAYYINEVEKFDILGQYFLNELDKQLGSNSLGDSLMNIGVGTFLNHARNKLETHVISAQHIGKYKIDDDSNIQWGLQANKESTKDKLHEWTMLDSAGYSLPYTDSVVGIYSLIYGNNHFAQQRISVFVQYSNSYSFQNRQLSYQIGVRNTYLSYNQQMLISPRVSFYFKPNINQNITYKFATGYYFQPPSYKEIRKPDGSISHQIVAQLSIHWVLGSDYTLILWDRPFRYITEIYYKHYKHLIPYQIDNVRIQYLGNNNAKGYAVGMDMKIHGEFVPGVESWASLSLLRTREDILDDFYYIKENGQSKKKEPGYIPRPTDQLVNVGIFFQDYLPMDPTYTMQLSLLFGSGLPFGPPKSERFQAIYRMPPYRRVDIGFAKIIKSPDKHITEGILKHFEKLWIGIEVFNLLDVNNTVSYQWVSDIRGHEYAVPNYLSSRRLNVKVIATF